MNYKSISLFLGLSFYLLSCEDCVNDMQIDEFVLSNESLNFITYQDDETLIFIDQNNSEIKLIIDDNNGIAKDTIQVRTIAQQKECPILNEYFSTEKINFQLQNENNSIWMKLLLEIDIENNPNYDSIVVYENIKGEFRHFINEQIEEFSFDIIIKEIENEVSLSHLNSEHNEAKFVGDTTIMGFNYSSVYQSVNDLGSEAYFNDKGFIYFDFKNGNYWKLKE